MLKDKNILIGITGGIAAYKIPFLIRLLKKEKANVKVIVSPSALSFVTPLTLSVLSGNPVYKSFYNNENGIWNSHIELANWADLFLIAPCTANTLAKINSGICDNLLLCTVFSYQKEILLSPAMDKEMFNNTTTQKNILELKQKSFKIIPPEYGELASGLEGLGRMPEPEKLFKEIKNYFSLKKKLKGKKVLITAGPTYEKIDPVRFIGNFSSGKMGFELAKEAYNRGADVTLITGPTYLNDLPHKIKRINIMSAEEMFNECKKYYHKSDIIIMAAAVADYKCNSIANKKIKKKNKSINLKLQATQDILLYLGKNKKENQTLIGFALETDNEIENAFKKLQNKKLDFIVLNSLNDKGALFGSDTNKITIIDKNNNITRFALKSKKEVAQDILNFL